MVTTRSKRFISVLVILVMFIGMFPMAGNSYANTLYSVDSSHSGTEFNRISICADLHLLGNSGQNNRPRFEAYLSGIQSFNPEILILCGDQYELAYTPPAEGEYSSESAIGTEFTNPYDEIRAIVKYYLGDIPIIFIRGNNDFKDNSYLTNSGFDTYFGLVEAANLDVFRFGVLEPLNTYLYSDVEIQALDSYLLNRPNKTKLALIAGHYPIDDGTNTPTNDQDDLRNAGNAEDVKAVLEKYDQPIVFLWAHNHDWGPELEEHIIRFYDSGYVTLNAGAVGYKETVDYTQGINMTIQKETNQANYEVWRYGSEIGSTADKIFSTSLPLSPDFWTTGKGTFEDPYQINSLEHLQKLADEVNGGETFVGQYFLQTEDIDLSGENWNPIGRYVTSAGANSSHNREFAGIYDGGGHHITNMTINNNVIGSTTANKGYGLFGYLTGTVRNLGLTNLNIAVTMSGIYNLYTGGISGYVGYYTEKQGFIENCFTEGVIQAGIEAGERVAAGGLAGYLRRGGISNSYSAVNASIAGGIENSGAGGVVGYIELNSIPENYITDGYWNSDLTPDYGISNTTYSLTVSGISTAAMQATSFVDILNINTEKLNTSSDNSLYKLWMSDLYTSFNRGYPIHEREFIVEAPIIMTTPVATNAVPNSEKVQVEIISSLSGASIFYTTDGTNPKDSISSDLYSGSFDLSADGDGTYEQTKSIKAVALIDEKYYSSVVEKNIVFLAKPTPPSGGSGPSGGTTTIPVTPPPLAQVVSPNAIVVPEMGDINNHWAETSIRKALDQGFVNGYGDNSFRPDQDITRAEFLTMLVKAFKLQTSKEIFWQDIEGHWAKEHIKIAANNGITDGLSSIIFAPDRKITREQMAAMLVRVLKLSPTIQKAKFNDIGQVSSWALEDIETAVQLGLLKGYADDTIRPKAFGNRAEAVEIIIRALEINPLESN